MQPLYRVFSRASRRIVVQRVQMVRTSHSGAMLVFSFSYHGSFIICSDYFLHGSESDTFDENSSCQDASEEQGDRKDEIDDLLRSCGLVRPLRLFSVRPLCWEFWLVLHPVTSGSCCCTTSPTSAKFVIHASVDSYTLG